MSEHNYCLDIQIALSVTAQEHLLWLILHSSKFMKFIFLTKQFVIQTNAN